MEELVAAAEVTGGKFFLATEKKGLIDIYQEIDSLQKSRLPDSRLAVVEVDEWTVGQEEGKAKRSLAPLLMTLGMVLFATAVGLETGPLRRWP